MGSKTKPDRSKKDSLIIQEPLLPSMVGGGKKSIQDQIATMCEISFHVKVKEGPLVKKGVPVTLKAHGKEHHILVLGTIVGKLSSSQSAMVEACARLKVDYAGNIVKEKNGYYAHFKRIIR
jgi:hypothetical protein